MRTDATSLQSVILRRVYDSEPLEPNVVGTNVSYTLQAHALHALVSKLIIAKLKEAGGNNINKQTLISALSCIM